MTQPTGTYRQVDVTGNREDLTDMIYQISPTLTPFVNGVGRVPVTNVLHEWQIDTLGTPSTSNASIQGDNKSGTTITATSRLTNRTQISDYTIVVAGTQRAMNPAGRSDELAYQIAQYGERLKRDIESTVTRNQGVLAAGTSAGSTVAANVRAVESWYATNADRGTSGASGGSSASGAATDGTQRAIAESNLKNVLQLIFTAGGNPDMIMCGPVNKQKISGFAGNATRMVDAVKGELYTSIDMYKSDFGMLKITPNRFQRERTVHVLETDMWAMGYLRPFFEEPLAKTGDADQHMIMAEWTLESRNEAASGVIADLTTS
jgi:hypothetical protein